MALHELDPLEQSAMMGNDKRTYGQWGEIPPGTEDYKELWQWQYKRAADNLRDKGLVAQGDVEWIEKKDTDKGIHTYGWKQKWCKK